MEHSAEITVDGDSLYIEYAENIDDEQYEYTIADGFLTVKEVENGNN